MIRRLYTNYDRHAYHHNWFIIRERNEEIENINESSHIFKIGWNKLPYNHAVMQMTNRIINNINSYDVLLYKDDSIYKCFEFRLPFENAPMINVISKLKIYVKQTKNIKIPSDIFVIASNLDPSYEEYFNPEVLPLFKSVGTTVQVLTIIMDLNKNDFKKDYIMSTLYYEFRHALDYIADKKLTSLSNKLNYPPEIFDELSVDEYTPIQLIPIYEFLRDCTYYTQDTEIKGHLDNAYYELESSGYSREIIIKLCKMLTYAYDNENIPIKGMTDILRNLPTLDNYLRLLKNIRGRIDNTSDIIFDEDISKQILDVVYHESFQERPFKNSIMDLLKKWERLTMKFIKQFTKAVYLHYNTIK